MQRLAFVILTALLLTGCSDGGSDDKPKDGDKDSPSASSTPAPNGPTCDDIWKAGATLPKDYDSCVLNGAKAPQDVYKCTDGTKLIAFNEVMYAVTGGKIRAPKVQPFQDTPDYGKVYAACTGE